MIYTAGKDLLTRKQLNIIKVPTRTNVSDNWEGINHGKLATTVVKRVEHAGLQVLREYWYTNPKRDTLWGAVDIAPENASPSLDIGQDACFSLGVRHSNLGRYAVSFAVGARIGVCDNGMFAGDFVLKKRHTKALKLEELVDEGITRYLKECEDLEEMINGWRAIDLTDRDAAYLKDVDKNWRTPPHEEFAPRTAWSLYNAFTETTKKMSPPRQLKLLDGMKVMFRSELDTIALN
jgi:hypothetical protein